MNRNAMAQAVQGIRKRCDTAGSRRIFDSLMVRSPSFQGWAEDAARARSEGRQDAANLPYAARQLEYVYTEAVEAEWPALVFAMESDPLVKWDTSVPEGAKTFVWYYREGSGDAEFFATLGSGGLPRATLQGAEQVGRVQGFGSEIVMTVQEMRAAAFAGDSLDAELGRADKQGHAQRLNDTAAWGREDIGLPGFLNHDQVPSSVAATKAAGGTSWDNATAGEIIADVLGLVRGIRTDSRRLYRPNVIALPGIKLDILAETRISEGDGTDSGTTTILEYLMKVLTRDGMPMRFRECEDLLAANSQGWLDEDAMIAFNDDPKYVSLVVPIFYRPGAVQEQHFELLTPVESSMGGIKFPYPVTAAKLTGI